MTTCNAPITVTPTDGEVFHTGRPLYRVECATHGLIHPGTTGPDHHSESHRRTGAAWSIDRPAPTPAVAPGLDLDAVDQDFRAAMVGPPGNRSAIKFYHETWPALIAEVRAARAKVEALTAELAAARAVPADVEAAILAYRDAAQSLGMSELIEAGQALRTAIARAIREAAAGASATVGGLLATGIGPTEGDGE